MFFCRFFNVLSGRLNVTAYTIGSLIVVFFGQLYILFLIDVFHYKFFQDTTVIILSDSGGFGSGSFSSARLLLNPYFEILEFLGVDLDSYKKYAGIDFNFSNIFFCLINSLIYFQFCRFFNGRRTLLSVLVVFYTYLLYVPYIGVPGKETNTLLVGCLMFWSFFVKQKKAIFIPVGLVGLYAAMGRYYYFVFLLSYFFIVYIKPGKGLYFLFYLVGSMAFIYLLGFDEVKGVLLLARPDIEDITNSFIKFPLEDVSASSIYLNRLYLFFVMLFPWQLLFNPVYWPYFIFGVWGTILIFFGFFSQSDSVVFRCSAVIISFYLSQSLFEPDFGSVFRHRSFLLPFYVYMSTWLIYKTVRRSNYES